MLAASRVVLIGVLVGIGGPILKPAQSEAAAHESSDPAEDLNILSLDGKRLPVLPPLLVEKDSYPDFTREMIRVQWRDQDPIYMFIMLPTGVKRPPVMLYLYSFPTEIDRFLDENFCRLLVKNDFAAAGFLSALTGHRYHDRPMKEWFISELPEALMKTTHDVTMLLDYLNTRSDLDPTRVGMFGEGSGGTVAVLAASVDRRIKAIDLLDPWGDWPVWLNNSPLVPSEERTDLTKPDFLRRLLPLDPASFLPRLTKIPIRYQYLTEAGPTPQRVRDQLRTALPKQATFVERERGLAAYKASRGDDFFDWVKLQVRLAPIARVAGKK